jgi:hypothetical protein
VCGLTRARKKLIMGLEIRFMAHGVINVKNVMVQELLDASDLDC